MSRRMGMTLGLLAASSQVLAWGGECEFSAQRGLALDARGVAELALNTRAGGLQIRGDSAATRISISGRACASSQALLDAIGLEEAREGDRHSVTTAMPEIGSGWGSNYASLDLVVTLPARLRLTLEDTSGDIEVEAVAAVKVRDSSGGIDLRNIAGSVEIEDNSGEIKVTDIGGDVLVIRDNSGGIRLERVRGKAQVMSDNSGSIHFVDIEGDAIVGEDGSGEIEFLRIGGNARVERDGSGSIRAIDVAGDFVVAKDGSSSIEHRGIGGRVSIPAR